MKKQPQTPAAETLIKTAPTYDNKTGEPLYPYSPDDYTEIDIVGHMFKDGQYLPVKVFAREYKAEHKINNTQPPQQKVAGQLQENSVSPPIVVRHS